MEGRSHGADDGAGKWDEQVVFTAAVRVLFWKTLARTRVHQDIDASDPECVRVSFRLLQSVGLMASSCEVAAAGCVQQSPEYVRALSTVNCAAAIVSA